MSSLFIFGGGGHSRVVADIAIMNNYKSITFVEKCERAAELENFIDENHFFTMVARKPIDVVVAIGFNLTRMKIYEKLVRSGIKCNFPVLSHKDCTISNSAYVNIGTVIFAGARIGPKASIDSFCVINHNASIDHDSTMDPASSLAPGSIIGGNTKIGTRTYMGIHSCAIHGISIGVDTVVGAGSVVTKCLGSHGVYYGSPAKLIRMRSAEESYL